jgi:uncharacterized protein YdcH (DUF465 family)
MAMEALKKNGQVGIRVWSPLSRGRFFKGTVRRGRSSAARKSTQTAVLGGTLGGTARERARQTGAPRKLPNERPRGLGPLEVGTMKQAVSLRGPKVDGHRLNVVESRHRELDQRLKELGRHAYLTPTEQVEIAELKKQKLRAKDELAAMKRM